MHTVMMIGSKVAGAAMTAGKAVAGAGAKAGAAVSKGGSLASMLQAGGSALSALQTFGAARQRARALMLSAQGEDTAGRAEIGNYDAGAVDANNRYLDAIARQNVAAAGSGVDVGSGTVLSAKTAARDELTRYLSIARENAVAGAMTRRSRAMQMRAEAKASKQQAWLGLLGAGLNTMSALKARGSVPGASSTGAPMGPPE
jgi:hypothetical protein